MKNTIYISILLTMVFSCKKAEDRKCWKSAGKQIEKIIYLSEFNELEIGQHISVTLIQDTVNYAIIKGAENLINLIETNVSFNKLTILNSNKCNFLRSYKKKDIHVLLHFKNISNIEYNGSEKLDSENILNLDVLTLYVKDGAGTINLKLNSNYIFASVGKGYGDLNFQGTTKYANFNITSNAYCNLNELIIQDSIDFISNTVAPCYLNIANCDARIQIEGSGNVIYRGVPLSLKKIRFGSGQILPE